MVQQALAVRALTGDQAKASMPGGLCLPLCWPLTLRRRHACPPRVPSMQNHSNEDIYEKAVSILETYFDVEDGEEENLAPAVEGGEPAHHGGERLLLLLVQEALPVRLGRRRSLRRPLGVWLYAPSLGRFAHGATRAVSPAGTYAFGAPQGFGAAAPAGGFNFGMQQ